MATARAVLIALTLALATLAPRAPGAATRGCLACHTSHLEERGTCVGCHRGSEASTRHNLAHEGLLAGAAAAWNVPGARAVREGERLREMLGCRRCHVTGGRGNTLAIGLDAIVWRRTPDELRASLLHPVTFMPDFALTRGQTDRLIAVLLRDGDRSARLERYAVRFRRERSTQRNVFAERCGGCHRALTPAGALGVGHNGPNLSGLLTEFYPSDDGRPWTRERLSRWLANPRAERPRTTMAPVRLQPGELDELVRLLGR